MKICFFVSDDESNDGDDGKHDNDDDDKVMYSNLQIEFRTVQGGGCAC